MRFLTSAAMLAFLLTGCASASYSWLQDPHTPVPGQVDTYTFGVIVQMTGGDDPIVEAEAKKIAEENMKKLSYSSYKILDKKCPAYARCVYTVQYVR